MRHTKRLWKQFYQLLIVGLLSLTLLVVSGCSTGQANSQGGNTQSTHTPSPTSTTTTTPEGATPTAKGQPTIWNGGWNSFMLGLTFSSAQKENGVMNVDYRNSKSEMLTQYVPINVKFYSIAPNGKDLLFQQQTDKGEVYDTIFSAPDPGIYPQKGTGNAIWMSDSRHVLILDQTKGVMEVDVQTGKAQYVLPPQFSSQAVGIGQLVFYRNSYLYFIGTGNGGMCMDALCRVQIGSNSPSVTQLSGRQSGTTYWLSPDGRTIYYWNSGPVGQPGIYAIGVDGKHGRIVRPGNGHDDSTGIPIGFASDNQSLVIMRRVNGKFQVVQLGASAQQDRVLLANAVPEASSLCPSSTTGYSTPICDQNIILAPYAHAVVVQSNQDGGKRLWATDLTTGKQQILHPRYLSPDTNFQLLGWDQLAVCGGNRC